MFIGLDCADLLYAMQEMRGRPGEPIARLTPLGWTCVGNPDSNRQEVIHTHFASTYFVRGMSKTDKLSMTMKRFREITDVSSSNKIPLVKIEDQLTRKRFGSSERSQSTEGNTLKPRKSSKRSRSRQRYKSKSRQRSKSRSTHRLKEGSKQMSMSRQRSRRRSRSNK